MCHQNKHISKLRYIREKQKQNTRTRMPYLLPLSKSSRARKKRNNDIIYIRRKIESSPRAMELYDKLINRVHLYIKQRQPAISKQRRSLI